MDRRPLLGKTWRTDVSAVRTLLYIPIVHTPADMGAFRDFVRRAKLQKLGRKGLQRSVDLVDRLWTEIEKSIDSLPLSYDKVCLYQDGLPVCGREVEIVTELATAGSRNHQLLLRLKERGAQLMGTESTELLVEEYGLIKAGATLRGSVAKTRIGAQGTLWDSLLERRDQYIANRINNTLSRGETGILFLGMFHSPQRWLHKDIDVIYALGRPSDSGGSMSCKRTKPKS